MNEQSLEKKVGINREGKLLKGSRIVPAMLLVLAAMILLYYGAGLIAVAGFLSEVRAVLAFQIETVALLALISLLPGLAGLIYRRAFWYWFVTAFIVLFLINTMLIYWDVGSIAEIGKSGVKTTSWNRAGEKVIVEHSIRDMAFLPLWAWPPIELLLIQLLLIWRLRRHSTENIDSRIKVARIALAATLIIGSIGIGYIGAVGLIGVDPYSTSPEVDPYSTSPIEEGVDADDGGDPIDPTTTLLLTASQLIFTIIVLLLFAFLLIASVVSGIKQGTAAKNIVVCLDGTWNQPGTTDFGYLAETNVFKLFNLLKGTTYRKHYNASQCKEYLDDEQCSRQIAFYYHGVGNKLENSELGQLFGGMFGMGAEAIIQRAYLDVVRVYRPGDRIFIFGFSRGAAIARVLAGTIDNRGAPKSLWTLRLFDRYWPVWTSSQKIEDVPIDVLGCWDTVGSFGISKNFLGIPFQKINLLKNLQVPLSVKRAYHMIALDETRDSFEPTLMDLDPTTPDRVIEVWFSGNHANIGGGYATDKLSNVTLDFLLRQVSSGYACESGMEAGDESWGLYLSAIAKGLCVDGDVEEIPVIAPDPRGRIRQSTGAVYSYAPRKVPIDAVIHDSVFERMKDALPVYAPQSLFNLNEELIKKREEIETEAKRLVETGSLQDAEFQSILAWSQANLSLTKWSKFLDLMLDEQFKMKDKLRPVKPLSNPPMLLLEGGGQNWE